MIKKEKDEAIKKIIQELCDEQLLEPDRIRDFLDQFQKIYEGDFRHKYSAASAAIAEYLQNNKNLESEKIQEILNKNFQNLISSINKAREECKEDKSLLEKLKELYDHCNLELQRLIESDKEKKLKEIIKKLCNNQEFEDSKNSEDIKKLFEQLQKIYEGGYRHKYSEISAAIAESSKSNTNLKSGKIQENILNQNLRELIKKARKEDNKDNKLLGNLEKLYDHCNLEFQRLTTIDKLWLKTEELQKQTKETQKQTKETQEQVEKLHKQLEDSQTQYVTMLGIFATMLAAFVSAMAVSSNVLAALKEASPYRLIFTACFVGLVFTNLLAGLFYFLAKITDRDTRYFSFNPFIIFLNFILSIIVLWTLSEYYRFGDGLQIRQFMNKLFLIFLP